MRHVPDRQIAPCTSIRMNRAAHTCRTARVYACVRTYTRDAGCTVFWKDATAFRIQRMSAHVCKEAVHNRARHAATAARFTRESHCEIGRGAVLIAATDTPSAWQDMHTKATSPQDALMLSTSLLASPASVRCKHIQSHVLRSSGTEASMSMGNLRVPRWSHNCIISKTASTGTATGRRCIGNSKQSSETAEHRQGA